MRKASCRISRSGPGAVAGVGGARTPRPGRSRGPDLVVGAFTDINSFDLCQVMASILPPHANAQGATPALTEFVNEHLRVENRQLKEKMEVGEEKIAFLGRQMQSLLSDSQQNHVRAPRTFPPAAFPWAPSSIPYTKWP